MLKLVVGLIICFVCLHVLGRVLVLLTTTSEPGSVRGNGRRPRADLWDRRSVVDRICARRNDPLCIVYITRIELDYFPLFCNWLGHTAGADVHWRTVVLSSNVSAVRPKCDQYWNALGNKTLDSSAVSWMEELPPGDDRSPFLATSLMRTVTPSVTRRRIVFVEFTPNQIWFSAPHKYLAELEQTSVLDSTQSVAVASATEGARCTPAGQLLGSRAFLASSRLSWRSFFRFVSVWLPTTTNTNNTKSANGNEMIDLFSRQGYAQRLLDSANALPCNQFTPSLALLDGKLPLDHFFLSKFIRDENNDNISRMGSRNNGEFSQFPTVLLLEPPSRSRHFFSMLRLSNRSESTMCNYSCSNQQSISWATCHQRAVLSHWLLWFVTPVHCQRVHDGQSTELHSSKSEIAFPSSSTMHHDKVESRVQFRSYKATMDFYRRGLWATVFPTGGRLTPGSTTTTTGSGSVIPFSPSSAQANGTSLVKFFSRGPHPLVTAFTTLHTQLELDQLSDWCGTGTVEVFVFLADKPSQRAIDCARERCLQCRYVALSHCSPGPEHIPLANFMFQTAQQAARAPYMMFFNADLQFSLPQLFHLIKSLPSWKVRVQRPYLLVTGKRTDLLVPSDHGGVAGNRRTGVSSATVLIDKTGHRDPIGRNDSLHAQLHPPWGMDYFLFDRQSMIAPSMRPFVIGRVKWDNWILSHSLLQLHKQMAVVDATALLDVLHLGNDKTSHSKRFNSYNTLLANDTTALLRGAIYQANFRADSLGQLQVQCTLAQLTRLVSRARYPYQTAQRCDKLKK